MRTARRVTARRAAVPLALCAGILAVVAMGIWLWLALPSPLFPADASPILLDRNGVLLGAKVAGDEQWRFPTRARVPERFVTALTAYEDKRFFRHPGVDPLAFVRALYGNLRSGRIVSGGSTLTMQVVRLARRTPERTYLEKLREVVLALQLELFHSKQEILALYAANAPFGGNVVGLEAATWRYFGRGPTELSWSEAALLAVLPNSPALIHPGRDRARLREKRDRLLARLHRLGRIDALDLELARLEDLPRASRPLPREAPLLLESLASEHPSERRFESTVDARMQRHVQRILTAHAKRLEDSHGVHHTAALVIDNRSFEIRAYVGNVPGETLDPGDAVDIVRSSRSTGSLLKPFLFAAMLEHGVLLPDQLVADVPTQIAGYRPENFDRRYRGAIPASTALSQSLNIPAVRLLHEFGVAPFQHVLVQLGMSTLFRDPEEYGLSLILGGAEGTLWELAGMYANLADRVEAPPDSNAFYRRPIVLRGSETSTARRAEIGPGSAWLTLEALRHVSRPGLDAHWESFTHGRPIAWKTGTSFGLRDAWAIGTTPTVTVAVWVGNANGEPNPHLVGVRAAAPILFEIFSVLGTTEWFREPVHDLKAVQVCENDGFLATAACEPRTQYIPMRSHFSRQSPYHERIHLNADGTWRVAGDCFPVHEMQHRNPFALPPVLEHYYRAAHPLYRPLPEWSPACRARHAGTERSVELIYPPERARIYIPVDLDGRRSHTIFEAVHRDPDEILYWHLDRTYLGRTRGVHQMPIDAAPGWHSVTIVDRVGATESRKFEVLGEQAQSWCRRAAVALPCGAGDPGTRANPLPGTTAKFDPFAELVDAL